MIFKNHVFQILLAFILGIILAKYTEMDWILAFSIWAFVLFALQLIIFLGRSDFSFRRWIGAGLLLVFFSSGMLGLASSLTKNVNNHYYKFFLPKDNLVGSIVEFEEGSGEYNKVVFNVEYVTNEFREKPVEGRLLCYMDKKIANVDLGNRLIISPKLFPIKNKNNPGEFDAESYWETQGITELTFLKQEAVRLVEKAGFYSTFWYESREYLKEVLREFISNDNLGVATALILGDKTSLTKENRAVFANSGAMHVLAVSGMHVGILLGFLQFIFYRIPFLRKRNLYLILALLIVWCFAFLTGLSASVFRAAMMFSILAIGQLRGYSFFSLNALLFSGLILLIIDANYLFNIGFQLSFLAMFGIIFFYNRIRNLFHIKNKWIRYLWEGTSIGIAAQIGTLPISLYYFHQFPNYFILTNVGLLILAGAALISGILLFIFHWLPFVNEIVGLIVDYVFSILNSFVSWINSLPFSVSTGFDPSWIHVLLLYLSLIGILYYSSRKRIVGFRIMTLTLFLLSIGLIVEREMNKELRELVVFNNYNKTVTLKENNQILCFFEKGNKPQLNRTKFLVMGYGKKMGSQIQFIPVELNTNISLENRFNLKSSRKGWDITYLNQKICLIDKMYSEQDSNCIRVGGAWNKYILQNNVDVSTVRSAFILREDKFD